MIKKITCGLVSSLAFALLVAGCAVGTDSGDDEPTPQPELSPQAGQLRWTIYYAEPAHINEVGYCVLRTCPPKGTTCSGTKTSYTEVYFDSCL